MSLQSHLRGQTLGTQVAAKTPGFEVEGAVVTLELRQLVEVKPAPCHWTSQGRVRLHYSPSGSKDPGLRDASRSPPRLLLRTGTLHHPSLRLLLLPRLQRRGGRSSKNATNE